MKLVPIPTNADKTKFIYVNPDAVSLVVDMGKSTTASQIIIAGTGWAAQLPSKEVAELLSNED